MSAGRRDINIYGRKKMRRCFLIGNPVEHSLSPGMHQVIYDELGLDWKYEKRLIAEESGLKEFVDNVLKDTTCAGFNVTVPHKEIIITYLTSVVPAARDIGAVNTVIKNKEGCLIGENTDCLGFAKDIEQWADIENSTTIVTGCGGAGKAVVTALDAKIKTSGKPPKIFVYDIDTEKAKNLANNRRDVTVLMNEEELYEKLTVADLLVNASMVGMKPAAPVVDLKKGCKKNLKIYDVVYNRITELRRVAIARGLETRGGIGMLAWQGILAFDKWAKANGIEVKPVKLDKIAEKIKIDLEKKVG